jgi:hypothetical protein
LSFRQRLSGFTDAVFSPGSNWIGVVRNHILTNVHASDIEAEHTESSLPVRWEGQEHEIRDMQKWD